VPQAYPLMLDVTSRLVVIIGGGAVAVRKVKGLLEASATRVRVVSPTFHAEMPADVERITATYQPSQLDGAHLVFAATDSPATNEQIARDARARGIWVNRSDEGDEGDFANPAVARRGSVTVAVSTGSAALSAALRNDLADKLDARHVYLAEEMKTLRLAVRSSVVDSQRRAMILRDLTSERALRAVSTGLGSLRDWIQSRYPDLKI
jgi:precorrin-2 dehydrogenase / sirohydrochlorin ferrochelatase